MSIVARTLAVRNFRSYADYILELSAGTTVLVGPNAAGKTNLVEALQLCCSAASFRRPSPADLVRQGAHRCAIELALEGEGRVLELGVAVDDGKRSFVRNGKRCRAASIRGVLPSVLFCPDDLDMVKRGARVRREALDGFGVQLNAGYAQLVSSYARAVEQRNSLLKDPCASRDLLFAWDEALVRTGSAVLQHRSALLERVRAHLVAAYAAIAPRETVDVRYRSTVLPDADTGLPRDREQIADLFRAALASCAPEEARRGMTLVGPHRDEVEFLVDGRPARSFASQGQQRSLVLAWKVAEVRVTRDILGRPPLLLLDDVMSELDAVRRAAIMGLAADEVQTVITTTNLGYFDEGTLESSRVVRIGGDR